MISRPLMLLLPFLMLLTSATVSAACTDGPEVCVDGPGSKFINGVEVWRECKVEKDVASEFYKKEAEEHKYLKDYEGYDSRQLRKMTHLERLNGKLHLFDYRHRNKLNQDAAIYIIED